MGFLKDYWGTQSGEFVDGFLAALDWVSEQGKKNVIYLDRNGKYRLLSEMAQEAVDDLAELPELFSETIEDYEGKWLDLHTESADRDK